MAKINYPDKTNSESAPESQTKFFATEANEIKQVVNHNATDNVDFSEIVTLDKNRTTEHIISGALHYEFSSNPIPELGRVRKDYIIANGVDKPTFEAGDFIIRYDGWKNEQNTTHRIFMEYIGNGKVIVDIIYV